jgi:hypothetical protein
VTGVYVYGMYHMVMTRVFFLTNKYIIMDMDRLVEYTLLEWVRTHLEPTPPTSPVVTQPPRPVPPSSSSSSSHNRKKEEDDQRKAS